MATIRDLLDMQATIVKKGSKHCVESEEGKNLGCSPSRKGAEKRLRQVEYFKHKNKMAAGGPGSGRHKYAIGERVMRDPKVWKDGVKNPNNTGVIVSHETGKDNKGKSGLAYRFLSDKAAKELDDMKKGKYQFEEWEDPKSTIERQARGTTYLEKELVPHPKKGSSMMAGGPGSGCRGDDCGRKRKDRGRVKRAKAGYVPATLEVIRKALGTEKEVAKAIGGKQIGDHQPFDVAKGKVVVEVKTKLVGKKNEITMHPQSLRDKQSMIKKKGLTAFTVCIDKREGRNVVYWREGVGSFKLKFMNTVGNINDLKRVIK